MTKEEIKQEVNHIFESGANEIRVIKLIENIVLKNEIQEQTLTEIRRIQKAIRDSGKNMNYKLTIEDNEIKFEISISQGFDFILDEERIFNACDFKTNIEHLQHFISIFDFRKYIGDL